MPESDWGAATHPRRPQPARNGDRRIAVDRLMRELCSVNGSSGQLQRENDQLTSLTSKYAKQIDLAVAPEVARSELGKAPLVIAGTKQLLPVYRVRIDLLAFNLRNGRFASEMLARQTQLGRTLNPRDPEDANQIRKLLLELNPDATTTLKEDLKRVGQTEPGIITHDGSVINANRRMAVLMQLHDEEPTGKYEYLEVMRLPATVSEKDLWRIEAGLQLSDDKRLAYGPVNDLLKIREGLRAGLSFEEIAASLYGVSDPEDIKERDERLRLIDSYLAFVGDPGNYSAVENRVEHFINLQNIKRWMDRQSLKAKEKHALLLIAFELIRSAGTDGFGHMDIRALREILESEAARSALEKGVTPVDGSLSQEEVEVRKKTFRGVFDTAKDIVTIEKEAKEPSSLLDRAERLLTKLGEHKESVASEPSLHSQVARLAKLVQGLQKACTVEHNKKLARQPKVDRTKSKPARKRAT